MFEEFLSKHMNNDLIADDRGRVIKYNDIRSISHDRFAVEDNSLVLCIIANDIEGLGGYLALMESDAVVMMVSKSLDQLRIRQIIDTYKPEYIYSKDNCFFQESLVSNRKNADTGKGYILSKTIYPSYKKSKDLKLLLGTSGSTGNQKFVRLTKQNILANAESIKKYLDLESSDVAITTLPPSYTYGLSIIHSHLLAGAKIVASELTFFDKPFWDLVKTQGVTNLNGVPYHYEILKKLRFEKNIPSSITKMTQAGGALNKEIISHFLDAFNANNIEFYIMYGQTEATARISYVPPKKLSSKLGSIGIAIPGGELCVIDDNGKVSNEINKVGEICYSGPNVSLGYSHSWADLNKPNENNYILKTGDLGFKDEDGFFFITGRLNRFIKLYGNRINLSDVEKHLTTLGLESACTGDDKCIYVYILDNNSKLEIMSIKRSLLAFCGAKPSSIELRLIQEIPRNEYGKIVYGKLCENFKSL